MNSLNVRYGYVSNHNRHLDYGYYDEEVYMKKITFEYQRYWMRLFSFVPVVMLLPILEDWVLLILSIEVGKVGFLIISILIMLAFVFNTFKYTGWLFHRRGSAQINEKEMEIYMGGRVKKFELNKIRSVQCGKQKLYGIIIITLHVKYRSADNGKERIYCFYSEDLRNKKIRECSLWKVYHELKLATKKNS